MIPPAANTKTIASNLIPLAAALWGLGVAVALIPVWERPAPPDQAVGYMKAVGIDAHAPLRVWLSFFLLPIISAVASRPLVRLHLDATSRLWAAVATAGALISGLWLAMASPMLLPVAAIPVAAVAAFTLLRRFRAEFSAGDTILVPTVLFTHFGLLDLFPSLNLAMSVALSAALVIALRLAIAAMPKRGILPAAAFSLAPLAILLQTHLLSNEKRHAGWPALLVVLATPPLLRLLVTPSARNARRLALIVAFVVYPAVAWAWPLTITVRALEERPRVDIFEDGHSLLPASEMLRGERPYRDIVPGHGLISDGLLDYAALRISGETVGDVLEVRTRVAALNSTMIYAVAFAATGSPHLAILAFFVTPGDTAWVRSVAAIGGLALLIAAVRLRRVRLFAAAGALAVVAGFTSLDFGFYTTATALVAALRFSGTSAGRLRAVGWLAGGAAAVLVPSLIVMALYGIADDFVIVTLREVAPLAPAYAIGVGRMPEAFAFFRSFPEILAAPFHPELFKMMLWPVAVLVLALLLTRAPFTARRRSEPLLLLVLWMGLSGISYAERHHTYFGLLGGAFLITAVTVLHRRRSIGRGWAVALLVAAIAVTARPTGELAIATMVRRGAVGSLPPVAEYWDIPRARYAYFAADDIPRLKAVRAFIDNQLAPGETWLDFSNIPILYFIFDRDCPIRQYEVPFFQADELQREVIARLERDSSVQAVLMRYPRATHWIDNVPNGERAPLVASYIEENFEPAFNEAGVEFWKRKAPAPRLLSE
jgi:hypothetical protein